MLLVPPSGKVGLVDPSGSILKRGLGRSPFLRHRVPPCGHPGAIGYSQDTRLGQTYGRVSAQPDVPPASLNNDTLYPGFRPTRGNVKIEPGTVAVPARLGDGFDPGRSQLRHTHSLVFPTIFTTQFVGLYGMLWELTRPTYGLSEHGNGACGALLDVLGYWSGGEGVRINTARITLDLRRFETNNACRIPNRIPYIISLMYRPGAS